MENENSVKWVSIGTHEIKEEDELERISTKEKNQKLDLIQLKNRWTALNIEKE